LFSKTNLSGFLFSVLLGLLAYFSSALLGGANAILLGLFAGIFIGNIFKIPSPLSAGIGFTSSKLLEISIIFLAFNINLKHMSGLGWQSFILIIIMIISLLLITLYLSKKFSCPGSTGWLVGFGTAICGSSAIAAIAPSITKNKEDIGIALAVVNLMGSIGMIALPFVLQLFSISELSSGLLVGGSLHSVGNVAGAGYAMGGSVGETAITIKLARVALLSPALIFFIFLIKRNETPNWKSHFKLPIYLWAFIAVTVFTSTIPLPSVLLSSMDTLGKITLTIAMTAIGLKVSFRELYRSGKKALGFGVVIFVIQLLIVSLGIYLLSLIYL
jgi:uncharacterized integral membrane protein (TIGR00698 family)